MKEKFIKIILAVLLVISVFPHCAYADEQDTDPNTDPEVQENLKLPQQEEEGEDEDLPGDPDEDPLILLQDEASETEQEDESELTQKVEDLLVEEKDLPKAEEFEEEEEEETEDDEIYTRTILMYAVGSDLESVSGLCSYNLEQILNSHFSKDDKIKFIVMTGGADEDEGWHLDSKYLYDPATDSYLDEISNEYNCIWEAKGLDAAEYPGKLVLIDGDGLLGDGEDAKKAKPDFDEEGDMIGEDSDYEWMSDPEVLRAFINYGVENYPAEAYDLILWDHGGGPMYGYGKDEHSGVMMICADLIDALSDNDLINSGNKFDFINFDACLMNSVELVLTIGPYTDYYIASPETVPGKGQYYTGWLDMLGEDTDIDTYDLGCKLIDDFLTFYEEGEGAGLSGTMAMMDMNKLLASDFVDALITINELMNCELDDLLFYDEISAISNSISYGNNSYYVDLGNLAAQICVAVKEFDDTKIPEGAIDNEVNAYFDAAMTILNILGDEEIVYNCYTDEIHTTGEFIYRMKDGDLSFSDLDSLGSSGTYLYVTDINSMYESDNFRIRMDLICDVIPDGQTKDFFNDYLHTMHRISLLVKIGKTISNMIDEGYDKADMNYDTVKEYLSYNKYQDYIDWEEWGGDVDLSDWKIYITVMINNILGRDPNSSDPIPDEIVNWMDAMIRQMAEEAIDKKNIELYEVDHGTETGYRVKISDTRKRVIDNIGYNLIAELPILEQWIEDNDLGFLYSGNTSKYKELSIGYVRGDEYFDMDLEASTDESFIHDYVVWLNGDTATWDLDPLEEKWYALEDAEGNLHVATAEDYQGYTLVPTVMDSGLLDDYDDPIMYMTALFFDGEDLVSFMMIEDGSYRPIQAEDLKKTLVLTPCMVLEGMFSNYYGPISDEFVITPENINDIKLKFVDIDDIKDIADTTGDGNKLTKQVVVTDIYGTMIGLEDMIENPTGYLTDINLATVLNDEYTGEELSPRVVYQGKILKEGVDYKMIKWDNDTIFKDIGKYGFALEGMGDFVGTLIAEYYITEPAPQYLITNGANATWQKGSGRTCDFTFKRNFDDDQTYSLFKGIKVDGKDVDASNYTYEKGSVIIHLKASYLETLAARDHSIVAEFADGQSKAIRFTIKAKENQNDSGNKTYKLPLTGIE